MCLGVPGQVLAVNEQADGLRMARVSFAGIVKEVCLAYLPEAEVGDYVIVHVGFAISRVDETEARQVFEYLERMGELAELDVAQPDAAPDAANRAAAAPLDAAGPGAARPAGPR
jgi:hydrogenase expression/formation protein HypC